MSLAPANATIASLLKKTRPRHRTAASAVTEALRLAIVSGMLPAGQPLRQEALAADLGISRMPIRESLRRLETEGLIDFIPHRGAVVARLQPEDIFEIAQMRVALECLALERAFADLHTIKLTEAEALLTELDKADSLSERNALNRRFHFALYGVQQEMRLYRHIDMLYDAYDRYLLLEHSRLDRRVRSQMEHRSILDACRQRDLPLALQAMRAHIEGAAVELVVYLANQRDRNATESAMD